MRFLAVAVVASAFGAASVAAQAPSEQFAGRSFSLELPVGFSPAGRESPSPAFTTIGYASAPRRDGTRAMVQVTLIDLHAASRDSVLTLEQLAAALIAGVRGRRGEWSQTEDTVHLGNEPVIQIAWRGFSLGSPQAPPGMMRGVMLVGIQDGLGFALHTQDLERYADSTLAGTMSALHTFRLRPRTAPPPPDINFELQH